MTSTLHEPSQSLCAPRSLPVITPSHKPHLSTRGSALKSNDRQPEGPTNPSYVRGSRVGRFRVLGVGCWACVCAAARGHGDGGGGVGFATWQETRMEAWGSVVGGAPWKRRARVPSIRYTRRILEFGLRESRRTSSPTRLEREAWRPLVREGDIRSQQAKTLRGDRGTDVLRRKSYLITSLTMSTLRSIQASPRTSSNTTLTSRLSWPLPACTSPLFPSIDHNPSICMSPSGLYHPQAPRKRTQYP